MYNSSGGSEKGSSRKSGIFAQLLIILLLTVLVLVITVGFGIQMMEAPRAAPMAKATYGAQLPVKSESCSQPTFKDCKDALRQGYNFSGLLTIKPDDYTSAFQVYCDMVSGGGGWTLVASIHEDDIDDNCDSGDKWSKTSTSSSAAFENWFNLKSFGNLEDVTGEDYKSKALYALNASDMMIWHVPNDLGLQAIDSSAFFKYHTTNGFLQKYGSNLHTLFTQYFPMSRHSPQDMAGKVIGCVQKTKWSNLWRWSWDRVNPVRPVRIKNTDKITMRFNSQTSININKTGNYSVSGAKPIEVVIRETTRVATTLVWIPIPYTASEIIMKVDWGSFGKNPRFRWDSTTRNDYSIRFGAQCGGPYCKVLFTVTNTQKWGSIFSNNFQRSSFYRTNNRTSVEARIRNMNRATLVGYTVFQRKYSTSPDSYDWSTILDDLPDCFDNSQTDQYKDIPSLSVPATFIKGDMDYYDSDVTPGFIQFRKYDGSGYPYPICPGIRLESEADPSLHCIGGIASGSSYSSRSGCGDFAAWDKLASHNIKRANSTSGADVTDLTSSLLLFYR